MIPLSEEEEIRMRLNPNANYFDFLEQIPNCNGTVLLQTPQGDILNLRSELCRFIFACAATNKTLLSGAVIQCDCQEDYVLLAPFLLDERQPERREGGVQ